MEHRLPSAATIGGRDPPAILFFCVQWHLLYKAWRDFALVEDGIEQGLRVLRDEDKRLKWTKKAQFVKL
ncbi:hypothetical protein SeMB42_g02684 [Synchytrium endobioticum]|uniref:Uncharacterized protein n=1 Tax=Synchytrium endobioticum TaxID=286115 RepID=A0A507DD98_9FUNG|nr:hypothetical protein SeMB42_g02684 [Synchytrium endobioticum]